MAYSIGSILKDTVPGSKSVMCNVRALAAGGTVAGDEVALIIVGGVGAVSLAGGLTTVGTAVTGSNTFFTTALSVGDILRVSISGGGFDYRAVTSISSNTICTVNSGFTLDLTTSASAVILRSEQKVIDQFRPEMGLLFFTKSIVNRHDADDIELVSLTQGTYS